MSVSSAPIFPPLTANETVVFDALALGFPDSFPATAISEVTGLDEFRTERALRSLAARNPPLAVATRLARLQWRLAC
jgi:hypothetical protein